MDSEIDSIDKIRLGALLIFSRSQNHWSQMVLKDKLKELGEVDKYKTRSVTKGYSQTKVFT